MRQARPEPPAASAPPHLQFTYNQSNSRPEVHMRKIKAKSRISRRTFIEATGAAAIAASAAPVLQAQNANVERTPSVPHTPIRVTINGKLQRLDVEDRWSIAEMLRDHLGLTGTKIGCGRGGGGACTGP